MREFHCFAHKNITSNCGWKSQVVWHAGQRSRCFYEVQSLWIKWGLPECWVFTPVPVSVKGSFAKWSSSGVSAPVKQRMVSVAVSRSSKGVEIWYKLQHSPFADPYLTLPYLSLPYRIVLYHIHFSELGLFLLQNSWVSWALLEFSRPLHKFKRVFKQYLILWYMMISPSPFLCSYKFLFVSV